MPLILAFSRQMKADFFEFKDSQGYVVRSHSLSVYQWLDVWVISIFRAVKNIFLCKCFACLFGWLVYLVLFFVFAELWIKPRTICKPGKCSTTELHPHNPV